MLAFYEFYFLLGLIYATYTITSDKVTKQEFKQSSTRMWIWFGLTLMWPIFFLIDVCVNLDEDKKP